jgi:hypothetical protein
MNRQLNGYHWMLAICAMAGGVVGAALAIV